MPFVRAQQTTLTKPSEFEVSIQVDGRVFGSEDVVVFEFAGRYDTAQVTSQTDESTGVVTLSYVIADIFDGAETAQFAIPFPLTLLSKYPNEGVDGVRPTVIVLSKDGVELSRAEWAAAAPSSINAWGAELTATWTAAEVVDAGNPKMTQYRYPLDLLCMSVGPDPIPAGSIIRVDLDANIFKSYSVESIVELSAALADPQAGSAVPPPVTWQASDYNVTTGSVAGAIRTDIVLNREVVSGVTLDLKLKAVEKPTDPLVVTVSYASAVLTGPDTDAYWKRPGGTYSVNDLTASGSPQITNVAQGSI